MILILTYAKVCSSALYQTLDAERHGDVFGTHMLSAGNIGIVDRFLDVDGTGLAHRWATFRHIDALAARLETARKSGEPITVISGVRDPITRSLSVAMQSLNVFFADCVGPTVEETAQVLAETIADLWMRDGDGSDPVRACAEMTIRAPLTWFEKELEQGFGFSLLDQPFDHDRGYVVLTNGNCRLFLYRYEKAPQVLEAGLAELFPDMSLAIPPVNVGADKPTAAIYRELQARFRLPRAVLERIYAHPYVRAFFTGDEIAAAIARWSAPEVVVDPAPRQSMRATVFIAMQNHAQWIGGHLDSLFAQWRPDVDLLLMDDGSTDGGLSVVLDRLSGQPNVKATVLRHSESICMGLLHDVVRHTTAPILIQADSDDLSLPGRLDTIMECFDRDPRCRLVTSNAVMLSPDGQPVHLLDVQHPDVVLDRADRLMELAGSPYWLGASSAFHRSLLEFFAPIDPLLCPYGFDLLFGVRATLLGVQHYLSTPLVGWRQHERNAHRLAGVGGRSAELQENLVAIMLMALAQRVRDIEWFEARQGALSPAVMARARADLAGALEKWARIRNEGGGRPQFDRPQSETGKSVGPLLGVPATMTLMPGESYHFGTGTALSTVACCWPGFHGQEPDRAWTLRLAIMTLRIPVPSAKALVIDLHGMPFLARQRAYLSVDFAPPVEVELKGGVVTTVQVPLRSARSQPNPHEGLYTLMIRVPEADTPVNLNPQWADGRLLGASLLKITVV